MDANDHVLRAIEREVGRLPASYAAFVTGPEALRRTWYHDDPDGEHPWSVVFYAPERVLDRIPMSVVRAADGLVAIGRSNADEYVLDVRDGAVLRWTLDLPWPAGRDALHRVDDHFAHFVRRLWHDPEDPADAALEALARHGTPEAVEAWLRANPVDFVPDGGKRTLAGRAATAGRIDVVERCIAAGCDTSWLVRFACRGPHLEMVRHLVETRGFALDPGPVDLALASPEVRAWVRARRGDGRPSR